MKIPKDNLTSEQKINAYLAIFFLVMIICAFFIYKNYYNEKKEELLSENTGFTFCKIVGSNTFKATSNHLKYIVNDKKFETQPLSPRVFNIGEFYRIKYSKSNPQISEVDYTKPIIFDKTDYEIINGIVIKTFENERLSVLKFSYKYENKNYERDVILEKIGELKKGKQVKILVNKKKPKISYLTEQINAE